MTMPTGDAQTSPPTHDGSTPPLPHAALAGEPVELTDAYLWWIRKCEAAEAERDRLAEQNAALLREAQVWAREARAQRATVHESYQAATGATGEPGDWNGAEPVRALVAERDRLSAELAALRGAMPSETLIWRAAEFASIHGGQQLLAELRAVYDAIHAAAMAGSRALATAAPTPPAAEAGTGGALVPDDLRRQVERRGGDANDPRSYEGIASLDSAALDAPQEATDGV